MRHLTNQIYLTKDMKFAFFVATHGEIPPLEMSQSVRLDTWYHVVGTYSKGGNMKLYINGQLESSQPLSYSPVRKNYYQGIIGCQTASQQRGHEFTKLPFKGTVDEISQYDRELTAEEVTMLYEASKRI